MDNIWFVAAIWMGMAFLASLISIRIGISVASIEILVGIIGLWGNDLGHVTAKVSENAKCNVLIAR
jgi:hypothetical protein